MVGRESLPTGLKADCYLSPHVPVPPSTLQRLNTQVLTPDGRTVAAARMVGRESLPTARPDGQASTPALGWAGPQAAGLARHTNVFLCRIDKERTNDASPRTAVSACRAGQTACPAVVALSAALVGRPDQQ